ncbi:DUF3667 domain-containing protein [Massilia sp. TS11]|uniref:DUF3667 domain-containing protein n=1 Tax=Massilia sp. TS11 TaxID=2908003 RepID=UPI001EDBCD15|nr:DUF3667 domain-containing protein [Massilia sp. TS11]MCG2583187.1 DUF3667 domain-containing protein [Massilia sp. TS11]
MTMDVDAAGNLAEAALVAGVIEGSKGQGGAEAQCANCQAVLTGPYCSQCGQKGHLHRSILHLGEELAHGTMHFDAKGWRTLPLLIWKPGELTRRYIDGQRTRFVSPLALFLFMVFLMFFVVSWAIGNADKAKLDEAGREQARTELRNTIAQEQRIKSEIETRLAAAQAAGQDLSALQAEAERNKVALKAAGVTLAGLSASTKDKAAKGKEKDVVIEELSQGFKIDTGVDWIDKAGAHAMDNPELAKYKLKNAAYKYAFLLVPISVPFLWLLFPFKRGVTMYDHAVFTLYSLSFMALLFVVVAVLGHFGFNGTAGMAFVFIPPIHMYRQLRGTYGVGRFGALWRTVTLLFVAILVITLYVLAVLGLSAA